MTDEEREAEVFNFLASMALSLQSINRNLFLIRVFLRGEPDAVKAPPPEEET